MFVHKESIYECLGTCAVVGRLADVDVRPESQFQLLLEFVLEVVHGVCEAPPPRQIGLARETSSLHHTGITIFVSMY